jgi:hypothetical protein
MVVEVAKVFLAVWIALFSMQASELLAAVVPDDCVEDIRGSDADPCPDPCPRCVCCARIPLAIAQIPAAPPLAVVAAPLVIRAADRVASADPHGILHVPKTL